MVPHSPGRGCSPAPAPKLTRPPHAHATQASFCAFPFSGVVLAPRAAAQTDTVAIVSEKGEDCYAAAAIKNGEGCLKYADTQGMFLCDSSLVMTGAYMKWQKVDAGVAGGFMLLAGNAGYVTVGGSDGRVNMIEFAGEESAAVFTEKDGHLSVIRNGSEMNLVLRQYTRSCLLYTSPSPRDE